MKSVCEHTPGEMERVARMEEDGGSAKEPGGRRRGIAGTLACEIHVGSLYYREFPFGGYCEEARGVAFFPRSAGARACTRVCAI